jgi:hypothetical protein
MNVSLRKFIKALTPYGAIFVYRKMKPIYKDKKDQYAQRKKLNKTILDIVNQTQPLPPNENPHIVISMTTHGRRIDTCAPLTIASLLQQSVRPDKLILWLAYNDKPSKALKILTRLGLEIRYCEDLRSYKKIIPSLRKYPDSVIITVDDDVTYPKDWLQKTLDAHQKKPRTILAHRARVVTLNQTMQAPITYWEWPEMEKNIKNSHLIFPNGIGGVLYPPNCFDDRVLDEELFKKIAPTGDDIWLWAMSELKGVRREVIDGGYYNITDYGLDTVGLWNTINNDELNGNDTQFTNMLNIFPELKEKIGIKK